MPTQRNWPGSGGTIWDTIFAAIPVEPFTKEMARLAARIDAQAKQSGCVIPFPDLLIGVTALSVILDVTTKVRPDKEFRAEVERICGPEAVEDLAS